MSLKALSRAFTGAWIETSAVASNRVRCCVAPSRASRPATKLPPRSAGRRRYASASLPEFDYLPSLSDENVGDVLQYLLVMVDAVEDHYADPLRRLRQRQYEQTWLKISMTGSTVLMRTLNSESPL